MGYHELGCAAILVCCFNEQLTVTSGVGKFVSGFYLMLASNGLNLILLSKMKLTEMSVLQIDHGRLPARAFYFLGRKLRLQCSLCFICALSTFMHAFKFWYLDDLGTGQYFMGICVFVEGFVAQVLFVFSFNWFIENFGCFTCVISTFLA
ncbi:hypothetical protein CEXT_430881 [Caerostris extrusa]|uniref:Uncharacterized protein n=1 Tax=Caerostris extrusa TaxID=172846 RepID=A0AAV4XSI0_CAEEX|nr:hypothetical protein CEXT_430881 [Caerostris extrusa]